MSPRPAPPLSPVLLAGFVLRPLPRALLEPFLNGFVAIVCRRHADVMARLEALGDAEFLIDPVDLPFSFVLRLAAPSPVVEVVADDGASAGRPTATVRAPLLALIDLAEGRIDGDALFFSHDLAIEGDTEAVLMLRNALDSGEIDVIDDVLSLLGPFARPARWPLKALGAAFGRAARDLETLRAAVVGPLARRAGLQANQIRELEEQLAAVHRRVRRGRLRQGSAGAG